VVLGFVITFPFKKQQRDAMTIALAKTLLE